MSMTIEVDSEALERAFAAAPEKVTAGLNGWVAKTALRTERAAKQNVPVRQGVLQNSIHTTTGTLQARVAPSAKYALYVHNGTGIYGPNKRPITPKSARVLHFVSGGRDIFVKSVKGQKANPFMAKAYKEVKPQADSDANKTLSDIVRSI